MENFETLKEEYIKHDCWGMMASIDLKNCNPILIREPLVIEKFVKELCELIKMKRYGNCQVVHFGEDEKVAGFSMVQLIETSLISGHFANATNAAYLDVFSCKLFDPDMVAEFSLKFFEAQEANISTLLRK